MSDEPDFTRLDIMTAAIRCIVDTMGEPSFKNLCEEIPNFEGGEAFGMPSLNIVLWDAVSPVAAQALSDLVRDGEVEVYFCHPAVYEGALPPFPRATKPEKFEEPRWLPALLRPKAIRTWPSRA
jgi:hypothetical protein